MSASEVAILRAEVAALTAEVAALRNVVALFYEAGRADALGQSPRVAQIRNAVTDLAPRHLTAVKP